MQLEILFEEKPLSAADKMRLGIILIMSIYERDLISPDLAPFSYKLEEYEKITKI